MLAMEQILQDKEKERMVLWTKVEALTRQLEELLRGDTSTSYINCHINTFGNNGKIELERLRQKLLVSATLLGIRPNDAFARARADQSEENCINVVVNT